MPSSSTRSTRRMLQPNFSVSTVKLLATDFHMELYRPFTLQSQYSHEESGASILCLKSEFQSFKPDTLLDDPQLSVSVLLKCHRSNSTRGFLHRRSHLQLPQIWLAQIKCPMMNSSTPLRRTSHLSRLSLCCQQRSIERASNGSLQSLKQTELPSLDISTYCNTG